MWRFDVIKNRSDKLKKIILPVILLALLVIIFTGCGSQRDREACSSKDKTGKGKATLKQEKNISREVPITPERKTFAVVAEVHMTMGMTSIQKGGSVGPKLGMASRKK